MRIVERTLRAIGIPSFLIVLGLLTAVAACDQKTGRFFIPVAIDDGFDPTTGDIIGRVTVDGSPRSGVEVTVRRNGTVVDTDVTDANGDYEFFELDPGTYTVSIGTITGATCPGEQTAAVVEDDSTVVDFACTSQPTTGTVMGTVTANGTPVSGATVALDGRTTTTDANGAFTFTNVEPGTYGVSTSASGFDCQPGTVTVTAGQTSNVEIACTGPPSGTEIAAQPFSLSGTLMGTDGCGFGMTISNPGPITILFDPATNTVTIVSDASVAGLYTPGEPWTGTGQTTFSSGGMTFILRETASGTWQRSSGTIVLPGTLTFEVLQGSTEVCESRYNATYMQLTASSMRFKTGIVRLLPDGATVLGLRPVVFRYVRPYGDPSVPRIGLIAEEVARVFPKAVALDAGGKPLGIHYSTLRMLVFEEIVTRAGEAARSSIARLAGAM
jgi:hypothetical protein